MITIPRPSPDDVSSYHLQYIAQVPEGDPLAFLETQRDQLSNLLSSLEEAQGNFRYAPGKWSLKEVLGHISDTERIFAFRLLCIARGETQSLPGFEQDDFVLAAHFDSRSLADLLSEFLDIRRASLSLLKSLDAEAIARSGIANNAPLRVATLAYLIPGHAEHHLSVIKAHYLQ
jgi:hypothetical protein